MEQGQFGTCSIDIGRFKEGLERLGAILVCMKLVLAEEKWEISLT